MFTQEQSIHIGRCNGCNRRCKLGVQAVVLYNNYINFRPTKNGRPIPHYRDKSGKKHFITTYVSATVALSHAYTAVKSCKHYVAPPQPVAQTFTDTQCHGCECKCTLAAQHISTQNREHDGSPRYCRTAGWQQTETGSDDGRRTGTVKGNKIQKQTRSYKNRTTL